MAECATMYSTQSSHAAAMKSNEDIDKRSVCEKPTVLFDTLKNEAWNEKQFSDITVDLHGKQFQLHRLVVCESPFFKSLFLGQWKNSSHAVYSLKVVDSLVTPEVFEAVVGTMYGRVLDISVSNAQGVYATSSFLQMEKLCAQCVDFILEHLRPSNVVDYLHFAFSHNYLGYDCLMDGCVRYLKRYATDLKDQLVDIPLPILREILQSDDLWVAGEIDRFHLVVDVFEAKMDSVWTCLEVGTCDSSEDGDYKGYERDEEFHDCPSEPSLNQESALPAHHKSTSDSFKFKFGNKELSDIREHFECSLCKAINYEHLTDEDIIEIYSRLHHLDIPSVICCFEHGVFKSQILRMTIQGIGNEHPGRSANSILRNEGLPKFRFGCELEDVMNIGFYGQWESRKFFYAGLNWWLKVEGKKLSNVGDANSLFIEVRVCCASASKGDGSYSYLCTPEAKVTLDCGGVRKLIVKDGAQWLSHTDLVLRGNELEQCVTPMGSIRFVVLIDLVFNAHNRN